MGDRAMATILKHHGTDDLYPKLSDVNDGTPTDSSVGIGAFHDSFYEYLLKLWLQSGRSHRKYRDSYDKAVNGLHRKLIWKSGSGMLFVGNDQQMEHLACFLPGTLALGAQTALGGTLGAKNAARDMRTAKQLLNTCYEMYRSSNTGLAADIIDGYFASVDAQYRLRPETIESLYILYVITGDRKYKDWSWEIAKSIREHCSARKWNGAGFAALDNVDDRSQSPKDLMDTFFMAETLKYLYLIHDHKRGQQYLSDYVFNTEAHPLPLLPSVPFVQIAQYSGDIQQNAKLDVQGCLGGFYNGPNLKLRPLRMQKVPGHALPTLKTKNKAFCIQLYFHGWHTGASNRAAMVGGDNTWPWQMVPAGHGLKYILLTEEKEIWSAACTHDIPNRPLALLNEGATYLKICETCHGCGKIEFVYGFDVKS